MAEKEIPNFSGLLYANGNLEEMSAIMKPNRVVLLGYETILAGALAHGMESACLTSMNVMPEIVMEVIDHMRNNRMHEAMMAQEKLTKRIHEICRRGGDYILAMKTEFNKINMNTGIKCGPCRKPLYNVINRMY